jgi:hypothetical protein
MLINNPIFTSYLQFILKLSTNLKIISQKTSYSEFDKSFVPNHFLSKRVATSISSVLKFFVEKSVT